MFKRRTSPRKAVLLSELVSGVLAPVSGRRGFAYANLCAAWRDVVGPRYGDCTYPDRIDWARGEEGAMGGVLRVRAEGPRAVLLQHELGQVVERVNAYFGYAAIARIRLVQGPVPRGGRSSPAVTRQADEAKVSAAVAAVGDDPLRRALARLANGVLAEPAHPAGQRR